MPPALLPKSGSVRPKQPMARPAASSGSQRSFCALEHGEPALHRGEGAQAGVAALELLHDEAVGDVVHAGAAVALEVRSEEAELGELRQELHGEGSVLADEELVRDELAHGVARVPLLIREQLVEPQDVAAGKARHVNTPLAKGSGG